MIIRKARPLVGLLAAAMFAAAGCGGPSLSDTAAIELIRSGRGYPKRQGGIRYDKISSRSDVSDDPLHVEMTPVLQMACVEKSQENLFGTPNTFYRAKNECLQYFEKAAAGFGRTTVDFHIELTTASIDITRVVDRRVDRQNGTVTVTFEEAVTPTPYFLKLLEKFPRIADKDKWKPTTRTVSADFEKWEKGWKLK